MSLNLQLNQSTVTNCRSRRELKTIHSVLCHFIKLSRLLASILNRILNTNNLALLTELIWDVLSNHFNITQHSVHLFHYNSGICDLPSFVKNLQEAFSISLLQNTTLCDEKYCEKLTTKLTDIDSKLAPVNITHHSSFLLDIPRCILSKIMSFLCTLQIIKIERTCSTFILASDENTSFSHMHFNFQRSIRKYASVSTTFFRRFVNISSLCLDSDTFKNVADIIHFLQIFKQLIHLQIDIDNPSDLNNCLITAATNPFNCIRHLTLSGCRISLEFFQCIKEFNMLNQLSFEYCFIEDSMLNNSPDLWDYYDVIQDCLSNVSKLEFVCDCDDYDVLDEMLSLTLMRLMITPTLQFLNIDTTASSTIDLRYHCPAEGIAFSSLKLKELDLRLYVDHSPQQFLDDILPFLTQLNAVVIRGWTGEDESGAYSIAKDLKNNFLYRLITSSLNCLEQIKFIHGAVYLVYLYYSEIFEPLAALYKTCILYPNWCKNVFKRFEFVVDVECDPGVPEEYEWLQKLLYFLKDSASRLVHVLERNNISYLIKLNIFCNCNSFANGDESMCIFYQCKEIFGLLWHLTDNQVNQQKTVYLTNKIPDAANNQRLITDYFHKIEDNQSKKIK